MPLVPAKCTSCGGSVNVDSAHKRALCPFCDTPFFVEQAIQNYNITNHNTFNVQGGTVILGEDKRGDLTKAADRFMDLGMYDAAEKNFREITSKYPDLGHGWVGLARAMTKEFDLGEWEKTAQKRPDEWRKWKAELKELDLCMRNAEKLGAKQEAEETKEAYAAYAKMVGNRVCQFEDMNKLYSFLDKQRSEALGVKEDVQEEYERAEREYEDKVQECEGAIAQADLMERPRWVDFMIPIAAWMLFLPLEGGFIIGILAAVIVRVILLPIGMVLYKAYKKWTIRDEMESARNELASKKADLQKQADSAIDGFTSVFREQMIQYNERWNGKGVDIKTIPGKKGAAFSDLMKNLTKSNLGTMYCIH